MRLQHSLGQLEASLREIADPEAATTMAAYMKDHFTFLGVKSAPRRAAQKPLLAQSKDASAEELLAAARWCWDREEREFQYVGADLLRKRVSALGPDDLPTVRQLITTKSWWDTVDSLAAWTVGPLVLSHRSLTHDMDEWIESDNSWEARTAILHQLSYRDQLDADRLFAYCERRAGDTDFFIRKAIGWALRQHARVDPEAVRQFVAAHEADLSGLSKREALKHLDRG